MTSPRLELEPSEHEPSRLHLLCGLRCKGTYRLCDGGSSYDLRRTARRGRIHTAECVEINAEAIRRLVLVNPERLVLTAPGRRAGLRESAAETGLVTFIQRLGSALNLNVHLHILVLEGACTFDRERAVPSGRDAGLARVLDTHESSGHP